MKVGHSAFFTILKKVLQFASFAFFISHIVGNIFLSSSIAGIKSWDSLVFVYKVFQKYCRACYFLNLSCQSVKLNNEHLCREKSQHSCACASSLVYKKLILN